MAKIQAIAKQNSTHRSNWEIETVNYRSGWRKIKATDCLAVGSEGKHRSWPGIKIEALLRLLETCS